MTVVHVALLLCVVFSPMLSLRPLPGVVHRMMRSQLSRRLPSAATRCLGTTRSTRPDFGKEAAEKYFDFKRLEPETYEWWERNGMFNPDSEVCKRKAAAKKPFVVPMPPPNVTGYLHMGHAIFVALQDIMARFQRMRGRPTLWIPGTDHAGIATQLLVERDLAKGGVSRQALGREAFLKKVWEWKEEKGGYITSQMRRLGASADWSREKFTLQPDMSEAVTEAFVRLHERGLIYRGSYMVNWSPQLQTAVSDLEVEHSEEQGTLYYFKYALAHAADAAGGEYEYIPVATTRPETILGDAAVCVHPEDPRYSQYIGRRVKVPFCDRDIPVIADAYVDREFGTGALKITPAHDPADYELGKRHNLPLISIMDRDASINALGGKYAGLSREQCRAQLWSDIVAAGLALPEYSSSKGPGTKDHVQRVPRSQRGGEVIEPMVSAQWFVRTEGMASRAVQAVRSGDIRIVPDRFERTWFHWLENIHDWCISRQLWWGHRIPVYYVSVPGTDSTTGSHTDPANTSTSGCTSTSTGTPYVVARSLEEAQQQAVRLYGLGATVTQDEDVLDTWFSSGLWPFATLGWPRDQGQVGGQGQGQGPGQGPSDLQRFYPSSVLETGYDILFFWVARMAMLGLELTDRAPFETIYLHGLVRDAEGRKMSKTTGNVLDPLGVIAQHGADALRYSLVTGSAPGNDVPLALEKIETNRNFANKLWNAGKYVGNCLSSADSGAQGVDGLAVRGPMGAEELATLPVPERYVVSRCHEVAAQVTTQLEALSFGDAGRLVHDFLWDEFADWYLEASKTRLRQGQGQGQNARQTQQTRRVLVYVWDRCLRLLHPFMPHLTEVLWQQLPHEGESVMLADWPQMRGVDGTAGSAEEEEEGEGEEEGREETLAVDEAAVAQFRALQDAVKAIRVARAEYAVEPGRKVPCVLAVHDAALRAVLEQERAVFALLGRVQDEGLRIVSAEERGAAVAAVGSCVHLVVHDGLEVFLPQSGLVDPVKERLRLGKQAEKLSKDIAVLTGRLNSPGFVDRAPPQLVEESRKKLVDMQEQLRTVNASIGALNI